MQATVSENDCRTLMHALKLRADELRKQAKKLLKLDRPTEARNLDAEADDIVTRVGPMFDAQGTFDFKAAAQKDAVRAAKDRNRRGPADDRTGPGGIVR